MSNKFTDFVNKYPKRMKYLAIVVIIFCFLFAVSIVFLSPQKEQTSGYVDANVKANAKIFAGTPVTILLTNLGTSFDALVSGTKVCDFKITYKDMPVQKIPIPESDRGKVLGKPTISFLIVEDIPDGNSAIYKISYDCNEVK